MSGGQARGPEGRAGRLEAAIFDLDGLLVDSEPLWHEAEVMVYEPLGVPVGEIATRQTKGVAAAEVAEHWFSRFPWSGPSVDEVAAKVADTVEELVVDRGELRPGAMTAVGDCRRRDLPLGLASSSRLSYLEVVLGHFDLADAFDVVHSAQDEPFGKPHPGVFLTTAGLLGVAPLRCLVLEDSPAGVLAAKAARMVCLAVPAPEDREQPATALADVVLGSLAELDPAAWGRLEAAAGG